MDLETAWQLRDVEAMRELLDAGADPNMKVKGFASILQAASFFGNEQIVSLLLEKGADVNGWNDRLGSALHVAARRGMINVVHMLLDEGADANKQGGNFVSVLQDAISSGNKDLVELLLAKGALVNTQSGKYANAIHAAIRDGEKEIVELLLKYGANIKQRDGAYGDAFQCAAYCANPEIVKLLLDHDSSIDVNAQGGMYGNALQAAICNHKNQTVDLLLSRGADATLEGTYYENALQAAVQAVNKNAVVLMLDRGIDINLSGRKYGNALQVATCGGSIDIVQVLLDRGADVNIQGGQYGNALQAAAYKGLPAIVQVLLDRGADINIQGGQYGSALQAAAYKGLPAIVHVLLDRGADINIQGGQYGSALQAAAAPDKLLQNMRIQYDRFAGNRKDLTRDAEHLKITLKTKTDLICQLLDKGIDVNIKGGKYGSALEAATRLSANVEDWRNRRQQTYAFRTAGPQTALMISAAHAACSEYCIKILQSIRQRDTNSDPHTGISDSSTQIGKGPEETLQASKEAVPYEAPIKMTKNELDLHHVPYTIIFVDTMYHLGAALGLFGKAVMPGQLRLHWKSRSGRRYYQDTPQDKTNLGSIKELVDHAVTDAKRHLSGGSGKRLRYLQGTFEEAPAESLTDVAEGSRSFVKDGVGSPFTEIELGEASTPRDSSSSHASQQEGLRLRNLHSSENKGKGKMLENLEGTWIVVGLPDKLSKKSKLSKSSESLKYIDTATFSDDHKLFQEIFRLYMRRRSQWKRFFELRSVHKIHLVKFNLRRMDKRIENKVKTKEVATATNKYKAPKSPQDKHWTIPKAADTLGSLSGFMWALWEEASENYPGINKTNEPLHQAWYTRIWSRDSQDIPPNPKNSSPNIPPQRNISQQTQVPGSRPHDIERVQIYIQDNIFHRLYHRLKSGTAGQELEPKDVGVEVEWNPPPCHVSNEIPQTIRNPIFRSNIKEPADGWGLWIDEEFRFSWKALVLLTVIQMITLVVGSYEWSRHGATWFAIANIGVTLCAFWFNLWLAITKDS